MSRRNGLFALLLTVAIAIHGSTSEICRAVEPSRSAVDKHAKRVNDANSADAVNMFDAMDDGRIAVKFIPKNAAEANLIVTNNTDQPLHIVLPETFVGIPILAQGFGGGGGGLGGGGLGGGGLGGGGLGGGGGGGGGQGVGGGIGGGGQGGGGQGGGGGGLFRVMPGVPRKTKATTVCLEHGKPDPTPKMAYKIIRFEQFTDNASVKELCRQLGHGTIEQNVAQAAAWHLANGKTWDELAAMPRIVSKYFGTEMFFSSTELRRAASASSQLATLNATGNRDSGSHPAQSEPRD